MHTFPSKVHINGLQRLMRVSYFVIEGSPVLKDTCLCQKTGAIYPVENWAAKFKKEALADMIGKAAGQELYDVEL